MADNRARISSAEELPDPIAFAQSFRNAAHHAERFQNLPNLNIGHTLERLTTAVTILTDQMTVVTDQVTTLETRIDNRFRALERRIDDRLEGMGNRFREFETRVDDRFVRLESRIDTMEKRTEVRLRIVDHNYQARLYNSHLTSPDQELEPLRTFRYEVPQDFPVDGRDLLNLTPRVVDRLLNAYGLPADGDPGAKRKRFRRFVGNVRDY